MNSSELIEQITKKAWFFRSHRRARLRRPTTRRSGQMASENRNNKTGMLLELIKKRYGEKYANT